MFEPNKIVNFSPALTEAQIEDLQFRLNMKMPQSLVDLYMYANGGRPERQIYTSQDEGDFFFHEFLKITGKDNSGFELSWDVGHVDPGFMPSDLISFGIDEGGAYYCIRVSDQAVIFYDQSNADKPDWAITYVSPSLTDFISNMR